MIVTDAPLVETGIISRIEQAIQLAGGESVVFDGVRPDPTIGVAESAKAHFVDQHCDAILAIGGGSSIDAAKAAAAAVTNGGVTSLIGLLKVKRAAVPLFAIPTTAGTGSEVSFFAVISDDETHKKDGILDPGIMPKAIALDPTLCTSLPKPITAATGIDALTHAIESYTNATANDLVREYSGQAVRLIFEHLPTAYANGDEVASREAMLLASYYAGVSLNVSAVGNVHAIAHQLGAHYGTPHGLANAMVLPHVLEMQLDTCQQSLSELADCIGLASSDSDTLNNAKAFASAVDDLLRSLDIPTAVDALRAEDIALIAEQSVAEGRSYAVPYLMSKQEATAILTKLLA